VGCVTAGRRHREVNAAELEELDSLRVVCELPGRVNLHFVTAIGVFRDFLGKQFCGGLTRSARVVGVAEAQLFCRMRAAQSDGRNGNASQ
jgi:hypothetical protein